MYLSLLDEIRTDLVNESAALSNTMRKAKILASALGLPEFREWVDFELSGYPDRSKVPSYRIFRPTNLGTFSGPFQSGAKNVPLPTYNLPDLVKDFADNLILFDGVGTLQGMLTEDSRSLQRKWPPEMVILARETIQMSGDMVLVDAHQPLPPYTISGILDNVKNKLLDFTLGLQENNITSEELDNGTVKPELVRQVYNTVNIYGDHNVVASGENVNQAVNPVQKGDIGSLIKHLSGLEVDGEDLRELEDAVSQETLPSNGQFGPKLRAWVGGMISKAASDNWKVGLEAAPKLLMDALRGYYGP